VSNATRERIAALAPAAADKIRIIPNGVDAERFSPAPLTPALSRQGRGRKPCPPKCGETIIALNSAALPLPADTDQFQIVYPSRILEGKGQHVAIAAFRHLAPRVRERAVLTIVGHAQDSDYLARLKEQAGTSRVCFRSDVEDIVPYYRRADIVIFPTLMEEGFGFTAVEAMACGKPVIHTDQPAIREATGGLGLTFPAGSSERLARSIEKLYDDPRLRCRLGEQGRDFVQRERTWSASFSRYQEVLEELAKAENR